MLFIKHTDGPFLQGQLFEICSFRFLERTSDFQTVGASVCWTSLCCYQRWAEWIRRFGQAQCTHQ